MCCAKLHARRIFWVAEVAVTFGFIPNTLLPLPECCYCSAFHGRTSRPFLWLISDLCAARNLLLLEQVSEGFMISAKVTRLLTFSWLVSSPLVSLLRYLRLNLNRLLACSGLSPVFE